MSKFPAAGEPRTTRSRPAERQPRQLRPTDFRDRLSQYLICRITDQRVADSIKVYNLGRELMMQLYELCKRDRPPVNGADAVEVSKASTRMPRERSNELMQQLLDEINRTGRSWPVESFIDLGPGDRGLP